MIARPLRVGVIGARRARQGAGDHLAHFTDVAGARVVAIAGTSTATVDEAKASLAARWGIHVEGHVGARSMLANEDLDAVVVASPALRHAEHLQLALDARLHALCEKPLTWGEGDFAADAARFADAFAAAGRLLAVSEQWPYTLAAYRALHPGVDPARARRFRMLSAPVPSGVEAIGEAMPHPLSLLAAVHAEAAGPLRDVRLVGSTPAGARTIGFTHPGSHGDVDCEVELVPGSAPPRPASYEFDGHAAFRAIREPGYRTSFATDEGRGREVPLANATEALVRAFVARASSGGPFPADASIARRSSRLRDVLAGLSRPVG